MPTGKDTLNPHGLMRAVRQGRDSQARVSSALDAFQSHLATSVEFAGRFDEAVMHQNHRAIIGLIEEAGLPKEAEVKILDLDPDRRIRIEICIFGHCGSITIEW